MLPDGSERYLVDEAMLLRLTVELGGQLMDPLKTTVVQSQRSMTTWVMRKHYTSASEQSTRGEPAPRVPSST